MPLYEIHGTDGLLTTAGDIRRARAHCNAAAMTDPRARVLRGDAVVYDPRVPKAPARSEDADIIEAILRHADLRCEMEGKPDIAIRPAAHAGRVEWWASVDVLTPAGSIEWWPATKGAKTPTGALRQLAREITAERRAEARS